MFENKNVLVVGGGSGIGLAIAQAFDQADAKVVVCGRTESKLEQAVQGSQMIPKVCDAAERQQVDTFLNWFHSEVGDIDVLAFCAGINVPERSFADLKPEDFDQVLQVNLTGAFNFIHPVLKSMRARKEGIIFNVSSIAGLQTTPIAGVQYSIAKTAQTCLGTFANLEGLADGVRLTNVYPGETNTPILDQRPNPPSQEKRDQMVFPEDIAEMIMAIAKLPKRAVVPELVITNPYQPRR